MVPSVGELYGLISSTAPVPFGIHPPAKDGAERKADGGRFGTLSLIGGGVAILGLGVFTYYGIRTESLHQEYLDNPDSDTRDQGVRARTTANVALGVALVGTALVIVDWATSSSSSPSARTTNSGSRARRSRLHAAVLVPE